MRALVAILACTLLLPAAARADDATETALRAALAQSTSQIADLENQVANLQAAQAPDTAMIEALKAQVQQLQKGGAGAAPGAAKPVSDKQMAALRHKLAKVQTALSKSQAAYQAAAADAAAKAAANTQLSSELAAMTARDSSCVAANGTLFKLGNQILDAYSHKDDVFGVMANREPFIGFSRVQLQNTVQNDQQIMLDNQIAPGQSNGQ